MDEILKQLSKHFDQTLTVEQIEEIQNNQNEIGQENDDAEEDEGPITNRMLFEDLGVVKNILSNSNAILELLMELTNQYRMARESDIYDNTHDSWEYFMTFINCNHFLAYFYCLIELHRLNTTNLSNCRLSLYAGRSYLLALTSPGAKAFGVFHIKLLENTFKLLDILSTMHVVARSHYNLTNIELGFLSFLDDLKLLLKHVTLDAHDSLKKNLIESLVRLLVHNMDTGFKSKYARQLHEKAYRVFDDICLPIQGNIVDNLFLILNGTAMLNNYDKLNRFKSDPTVIESISDWFLGTLIKIPEQTVTVLKRFIETILTNSIPMTSEQLSRNIDICVKYDSAMLTMCNESIFLILKEIACSTESSHRCNCAEIIGKILLIDSGCDWSIFRDRVSQRPREIDLLDILIYKMYDVNNSVKIKAMASFVRVAVDGNKNIKMILKFLLMKNTSTNNAVKEKRVSQENTNQFAQIASQDEGILTQNSSVSQCGDTNYTNDLNSTAEICQENEETTPNITGIETLATLKTTLLAVLNLNIKNKAAIVRKQTLILLEYIATTTINIDEFLTSAEFYRLRTDSSSLVRRQLILTTENILKVNYDNKSFLESYIMMTLGLGNDIEVKVVDTVMESLKRNIFDKIVPYEHSSSSVELFPWKLLQAILCSRGTPDLRSCIHKWIGSNLITTETLSNIETYIDTSNSTAALILLSMIAPKIKSRHPERAVAELFKNLQFDLTKSVDNSFMQLEVIVCWLQDLSSATKNELFIKLSNVILTGGVAPRHIQRTYELCSRIIRESSVEEEQKWARDVCKRSMEYILKHQKSLFIPDLYNIQLISYIYIYSETMTDLPDAVNPQIIEFFIKYLKDVISGKLKTEKDATLAAKVNCLQNVLARFAIFNYDISYEVATVIGDILAKVPDRTIILTSMVCLGDLCKKHTSITASVLPHFLSKTQHEYFIVREAAIQSIATLILEDYLKFRGSLLLYILAAILDEKDEIRELATEIILKYTLEKNALLMVNCLGESPFVFNGCLILKNYAMFPADELQLNSPLIGHAKQIEREMIYCFFIHYIDPLHCYMYFDKIHFIFDKVQKEPKIQTKNGLAAIRDFLFICTQICLIKEKIKIANIEHDDHEQNDLDDDSKAMPSDNSKKKSGTKQAKHDLTIEKTITIVDKAIPVIHPLTVKLLEINGEFMESIDKLCEAVCMHFEQLTEYAQPASFWNKYRRKSTKRKVDKSTELEASQSDN